MIKYGKEEHLKQIIDGKIRFSPSQTYIKMEKELHNKGQGDLLEGKMRIKSTNTRMHDYETKELKLECPNADFIVGLDEVNNMPIFCISKYDMEDTIDYIDKNNYKICISQDEIESIKKDFSSATHALIILEPDRFIDSIKQIDRGIKNGEIRYYDYSINPLQMFMYLTTGEEEIITNQVLSFTEDNKYRILFCKDIAFANQKEYRFINTQRLIDEAISCDFNFNTKYLLIPIEELKTPVQVTI